MKAVVTGGTGFIGGWLVKDLLHEGYDVTVLVRSRDKAMQKYTDEIIGYKQTLHLIEYDASDMEQLQAGVSEPDVFFHLAWGGVAPEKKNDLKIQTDNITGSIETLKFAHRIGAKRFIAVGTVAEYVMDDKILDVDRKQSPNDIYGAAKVATHYMLEAVAKAIGQPFNWAVLPSTYGEGRTDGNILTYTITTLLKGEKPKYGDLCQMWDFVYVSDVVRALRLIGEKGQINKTYGIGSGKYQQLRNFIMIIRDIIDPSLPLGIGENQSMSGKTVSSCVDIYELVKDTGFSAEVEFADGIKRMITYEKAKMDK